MCSDLESTYSCGHCDMTRTYFTYYRDPKNKVLHYTDCRDYKGYAQEVDGSCFKYSKCATAKTKK
ncbi:uncharacterized protein RCO7_15218 [Rhynchosporium graminicola]|uniref:Uncharacterized protein n=1 Tax=Rhynchosporium graminicola TaxID=2792576 RepID=A0A1E1LRE3_9HELO|nr:uncharacterized protein RCO7_15218 [Rhynchosporium commune]